MIDTSEITTHEYNVIYHAIEREMLLPERRDGTPDIRVARAAQRVVKVLNKYCSSDTLSDK